jgi:hydrogenase nickel incorporation protein HypA/HybF
MHELSIVLSIIEGVTEEAKLREVTSVSAVHLRVGALSGVVKQALLFAYDLACEGTLLEGSQLIVEESPVVVHCCACDADHALKPAQPFCCPVCGAYTTEVLQGREIQVVAMEIM